MEIVFSTLTAMTMFDGDEMRFVENEIVGYGIRGDCLKTKVKGFVGDDGAGLKRRCGVVRKKVKV